MNNTYGGALPSNSSAANASKYQTNLGRTKTKKWVQASVPNYDGDDWGDDYDDEPEPEPAHPHAVHQQTWPSQQHPPSLAPGLGSRPMLPSEAPWTPTGARKMSGPMSLPSQGQQQPGPALPAESDQSWQERRSFTTGTTDALRTESILSPTPLATISTSTPPPPPGAGPSSLASARERAPQDMARTASPPTAPPGGPPSAPQSPATKFPPRKSSMSHKDGPPNVTNFGPLLQSSSNPSSKPGSPSRANNPRPWMEARSGSPQGPRSPPQTGKPLPFVRPADIYKRLEEEKEKERRSLDSGRPSLDSLGAGSGGDYRVGSPGAASDSSDRARRTSFGKDDAARDLSPRSPRPQAGLATVAERTSEYGLEDYYVDAGVVLATSANNTSDEAKKPDSGPASTVDGNPKLKAANESSNTAQKVPASVPAPAPATVMTSVAAAPAPPQKASGDDTVGNNVNTSHTTLPQHCLAQQQPAPDDNSSVAESDEDDIRRFSTSPVLPDFSRMSSFGVDMFGSFSPGDELQPSLTTISEQQPQPPAERGMVSSPLSQVQQSSPSPAASSSSTTPAPGPQGAAVVLAPPTDTNSHAMETTGPAANAGGAAAQAIAKDRSDTRSDTPLSSTSDLSAAPQSRELADSALPRPVDEASAAKLSIAPLKESASRSPTAVQTSEKQTGLAGNLIYSRTDLNAPQAAAKDMQSSTSSKEGSRSSTPRNNMAAAPPPASSRSRSQSPSKVQAMIQAMNQANAKAAGVPQQSGKVSSGASSPVAPVAPQPLQATQAPAVVAPPAPQRASPALPELEPLGPVTRASTFTTTATESPVKESDKLREEIMLSLSPQQGGGEFTNGKKKGLEAISSGVPRESTYLGDVYDDYYGGHDDSTEEPISEKAAVSDKVEGTANEPSSAAPMPKPVQGLGDVPPLNPSSMSPRPLSPRKSQPSVQIPALKHRFSWEMGEKQVDSPAEAKQSIPAPAVAATTEASADKAKPQEPEPKSLSIVPPTQPPAQPPSSLTGSPLSPSESNSDVNPITSGATNTSHSVSEASTLPPGKLLSAIELPSPISVRSDEQNKSANEGSSARTLAEEKKLMTSTSSPISPTPREEHPAFLDAPTLASAPAVGETAASPTETTPTATGPVGGTLEPTTMAPTLAATAPTPTTATPTGPGMPQSPTASPASHIPAKIAPFKEIMALPTAAQRIERLDETRDIFSKIDSGLVSWLVVMTQVPENSNASWSLKDNITNEMLVAGGQKPGHHQPGHGATATNGGGGGGTRPVSGLASGSQFTAADLRHSSKEVGAKGKELLMAGGKAAKGLFSKGKSKFRAFDR